MSSSNSYFYKLSQKNLFLKKIFIYYNVYIRNFKFLFNSSQLKEDEYIISYFKKGYKGNFVDLGCFHPTRHNNTFQLYKKGWRGINIDLNKTTIGLFDEIRPHDINICAAISNKKAKTSLYYLGDFSVHNTIEKNNLNLLQKHFSIDKKDIKVKKIKTERLDNILDKYNFFKVDFMSIDIEGEEIKVLQTLDLRKFNIKYICIEIFDHNKKSIENNLKVIRYLKKNGYILKDKTLINYIYKKKN
tara:strand:- start:807 stop:1538 length:732 start_codon:yes stop_codon:yes gene_type:complete